MRKQHFFTSAPTVFVQTVSTQHAIAQCCRLMQIQHLHYAVDLDIHGFFDNVHHGKLIRQMWELGIRDKKLLCIIKQMLRAPIVLPDGKRIYPPENAAARHTITALVKYRAAMN